VQAHYLGYPGTVGAQYLDGFLTDEVVTPPALEAEFTERVVRVPRCFMASAAEPAESSTSVPPPSRAEAGLPADAFVYCNFGTASRMTRDTFELWLDVLRATPGSVLWLADTEAPSVRRLRDRARAAGVEPARLVFAQRAPSKRGHLARLALADLMLDTIGWYNGHSTTADALWAGVPVLTAPAGHFAGRVAASLVQAAGLDELVATDRAQYRTLAMQIGGDRPRAQALRQRLAAARAHAPFFDTRGRVADLESAIDRLWATTRGVA
jgi:predicted O-linked N-acetylglucosamine transferase (SPINDLY family)